MRLLKSVVDYIAVAGRFGKTMVKFELFLCLCLLITGEMTHSLDPFELLTTGPFWEAVVAPYHQLQLRDVTGNSNHRRTFFFFFLFRES